MYKIFAKNSSEWDEACSQNYILDKNAEISVQHDIFVLPLKKNINSNSQIYYSGGIIDAKGNFIAGLIRKKQGKKNESFSYGRLSNK